MATNQTRQSKEQAKHLQKVEQYKKDNSDKKYIVWGLVCLVFLFSFAGQIRAFKEVQTYAALLVIIGLITDLANIFIEAAIAVDEFAKEQIRNREHRKKCELKDLLPIPQSYIHYAKMIWGVRLFWVLLIGYVIYMGSNKRNKADFDAIDIEISSLENQRISINNSTISQENDRQNILNSLNKELSLQRNKKADIEIKAHNDDWLLRSKYSTQYNSAKSSIETIEGQIKALKPKKMTDAEANNQKAIDVRIQDLKKSKQEKGEKSEFDRNADIAVHILLMLISMFAIFFSVKELVRYLIHSGYYHKNIQIIETDTTPSVKPQPKINILREAITGMTYFNRYGEEKELTVQIITSWKNTKTPKSQAKYRAFVKEIEAKGYIVEKEEDSTSYPKLFKK